MKEMLHCSLCGELSHKISTKDIVGKSYQALKDLIDKYNNLYDLDIKLTGGGYGFELSSYKVKEVELFRKELKSLPDSKLYIISYVKGSDEYVTSMYKRNDFLRGRLCSSLNKGQFMKTKNSKFFMIKK